MEGTLDDGLTVFKSNFLMNVEEAIGEFNFVLNRPVYWAFDKAYPYVLKTAAKIRSKE
jgi:serine/alanine adding enzyme